MTVLAKVWKAGILACLTSSHHWVRKACAIYHQTGGSDEGLELADAWSSKGEKYRGKADINTKWRSFRSGTHKPISIATLCKMVQDNGHDWRAICDSVEPQFKKLGIETIVVKPGEQATEESSSNSILLDKYSLLGRSHEIEKQVIEEKPVLGEIALQGQITELYAPPNVGKTLITLSKIIEAIQQGQIDPSKVYYLNMDDNSSGLLEKLRIAEEFGFHMLADGYQDFNATQFVDLVIEMIKKDQAHGVILILDTLKKVVDLMDKGKSSRFMKVMRRFVLKGGTVIALAHTNKHRGKDGKLVYGGVSDLVNDCDCAYTLDVISRDADTNEVVVEFTNIKRRGNVVLNVAYSYRTGYDISYLETLMSVRQYDESQLAPLKQATEIKEDANIIEVVTACIGEGINTKMKLAVEVGTRAGISRQSAIRIIEKYTGTDPTIHKWQYTRGDRGAQRFTILDSTT